MAYFKQKVFNGIVPALGDRLVPDNSGQIAENVDFQAGNLQPIEDELNNVKTLANSSISSIYNYEAPNGTYYWLQFPEDNIKAVPGPIPNDTTRRIYWTGQTYPKMSKFADAITSPEPYPTLSHRLGVPQPKESPAVSKSGTANPEQVINDVAYVYTVVNDDGEEGPPSQPSSVIQLTDDETGILTINYTYNSVDSQNQAVTGYNISTGTSKIRIYRSNSGSTRTTFQFAGEISYGTTTFNDTNTAISLGEVLPSATWIGPPDDDTNLYPTGPLQGLIPLASSVLVGFTGKRVCVSERYLPHAWPVQYRITLDRDIIGLATTRGGVIALTTGKPVFVTGTDPAALTQQTIDFAQSCVNEHSIVDMGDYVIYAGPDGLCAIEGQQGRVLTDSQITAPQWNADFSPTTYKAFRHENTYVAFFTDGGTHSGFVYDPRGGTSSLSTITTSGEVKGGFVDEKDNELYLIIASKIVKYRGATTFKTAKYKSKKFITDKPTSMSWLSIVAATYPVTSKVYVDGNLIANYTIDTDSVNGYALTTTTPASIAAASIHEPLMRLPAAIGQEFEVEIESQNTVHEFCLSQSTLEIQST